MKYNCIDIQFLIAFGCSLILGILVYTVLWYENKKADKELKRENEESRKRWDY